MEQGEDRERTTTTAGKRRLTADVSDASLQLIARLKAEWGLRSRGAVLDRLLTDLLVRHQSDPDSLAVDSSGLDGLMESAFPALETSEPETSAVKENGPTPSAVVEFPRRLPGFNCSGRRTRTPSGRRYRR